MSAPRRFTGTPFLVPNVSTEEVGWKAKLSKWQWALVIGLPLAAAAAVAGLVLLIGSRRRRVTGRDGSPPPSMTPTPVASPTSTTVKTAENKEGTQEIKQRGNSLFKQGKLEEAAQCYMEAIGLAEGEEKVLIASCHQNLAAVYDELVKKDTDPEQKARHQELVIENCDSAIAIDPRYVKALLRRFKMHFALGHQEEALLDVTRVLLLDESHAQSVSANVTTLLKDLSQAHAAKTFHTLGPLPPTKYLVKTYSESYIWKDDISEERLKALWLQAHTHPADQSVNANMSHDPTSTELEEPVQETEQVTSTPQGDGGDREVGGEEEEERREAKANLENGGRVEGEGEGDVGEGDVGEGDIGEGDDEEKEKEEGEREEEVQKEAQGDGEEEKEDVNENAESDAAMSSMAGFSEEPFIQAAAQYGQYELNGILDLLTRAIEEGHEVFKSHALLLRGSLYALWRMENESLRDLQDLINTQALPKQMYVNALIKRAGIFAGRQSLDKCRTCLEKAVSIDPDSIDILIHRARVSLETEDLTNLQSVISDLSKAVSGAPEQPYPLYSLASSFHRLASINQSMQFIETARSKFQEAFKKFPKFGDGLILYALFLQDTGDFQQAEEVLNKVVCMEPENPLGHFSLGLLYLVSKSDIDRTMLNMQKAIAVDISCVQAYDTMASIEMQRGNVDKAVELYDKAVKYSRNQVEMTQAYVAQKVFSMQDRVCKEYGVSINEIGTRSVPLTAGSPTI